MVDDSEFRTALKVREASMRIACVATLVEVLCCTALALAQAPDGGLPRRPALGVALAVHEQGVLVTSVTPGSAAVAAGIQAGDIIAAFDGAPVRMPAELVEAVTRHRAGETVRFDIVRHDRFEPHAVTLQAFPRETLPGVHFEYGAVTLGDGTRLRTIVSIPDGSRSPRPAVMLLQGGGCNSIEVPPAAPGATTGLLPTIASHGYVTMRVEKSGLGDSRGPACDTIGYTQELDGYRAALAALKRHPAVDPDHVVLLGLSLGGVFAPVLANEYPVRAIVVYGTLASPPLPYPGRSERFFREFAPVDIKGAWSAVSALVLVLHGEFDETEAVVDHTQIAPWVNARHPGAATHRILEGLDHCWTRHASMEQSRGHCGEGQPVTTLADAVLGFLGGVP
jgi:dienelactone hydrolase